jgi:hypothetical protein
MIGVLGDEGCPECRTLFSYLLIGNGENMADVGPQLIFPVPVTNVYFFPDLVLSSELADQWLKNRQTGHDGLS